MKILLKLCAIAVVSLGLFACGGDKNEPAQSDKAQQSSAGNAPANTQSQSSGAVNSSDNNAQ